MRIFETLLDAVGPAPDVFIGLLNGSLAAGILILVVVLLRFALRRAPKWTRGILWALVAVRLACPVALSSPVSAYGLLNGNDPAPQGVSYFRAGGGSEAPQLTFDTPGLAAPSAEAEPPAAPTTSAGAARQTHNVDLPLAMTVWAAGLSAMLLYALVSWLVLRYRVRAAARLEKGLCLCDGIPTPFILGLFRPRVYLPSGLSAEQIAAVIAHERAHLARRDHWWKPLGFLLLAVHWFNPLVWFAYVLLCRDIELACDEKAVRALDEDGRADYSQALLDCSAQHRLVSVCPLAFGEVGVKARVKAVLNYKKPAFWIVAAALVVCVAAAVCFLTNPAGKQADVASPWQWTHAVTAEEVTGAARTGAGAPDDGTALTRAEVDGLVSLLNGVQPDEMRPGRGIPTRRAVKLTTEAGSYTLQFDGGLIVLVLPPADAERWPLPEPNPSWEIHNDALYAFLDGLESEKQEPDREPGPQPSGTEALSYADQLAILAANADVWRVPEEFDAWGYAVTDLDQNGRLEILSSACYGTGHYSTNSIWEVGADGTLLPAEGLRTEYGTGTFLLQTFVPVYRDPVQNVYHYVFHGEVRSDANRYYATLTGLTFSNGSASELLLASQETEYGDSEPVVTYALPDGKQISAADYNAAADRAYPDCQKGTAYLSWIQQLRLGETDAEALLSLLTASFEKNCLFFQNDGPSLAILSAGETVVPFSVPSYAKTWTEHGWLYADGGPTAEIMAEHAEEIPTLTWGEDFDVRFAGGTSRRTGIRVYNENFRPRVLDRETPREYWYGNTAVNWLEPGTYYCVLGVFGPPGAYIASEQQYEEYGYDCIFRLVVPAGGPLSYMPDEIHDLTEARLVYAGREIVLTDGASLAELETLLSGAKVLQGGAGCPFTSVLYLTRADGYTFSACPAEDSCGVLFAGGGYFRYAGDNAAFWMLFGVELPH